jgi:hypothetical protein
MVKVKPYREWPAKGKGAGAAVKRGSGAKSKGLSRDL